MCRKFSDICNTWRRSHPIYIDLAVAEFNSFIRGYHIYSQIWDPAFGEVLILEREPNNAVDSSAVAVKKEHKTVGHVPYNTASVIDARLICGGS